MRVFFTLCCLALPAQADMQAARGAFTNAQFEKAVENLIPAANSGNAEAEFLLGNIYTLGLGVTPDATRGFEFYLRAATKGHPAAQLRLSRAFETGKGTTSDPIRALLWSDLAAIGRADSAKERSQSLRNTMTHQDIKIAEDLLQDYRTYLFPLDSQ
jgi:TPR repeat protein